MVASWLKLATAAVALVAAQRALAIEPDVSPAKRDARGVLIHEVTSQFQSGTTQIRVLLPDKFDRAKAYPIVYVLPVETGTEHRYGDGLAEIQTLDLHNARGAVFVGPTFAQTPWYADHPTRPEIRQESHLLEVVVPLIDRMYASQAQRSGAQRSDVRLLLGFSKSGCGAFSLLLRHPDMFARAAAWDAPLAMEQVSDFGSQEIFGTQANFAGYQFTRLAESRAAKLRGERLILLGYGNFRADIQAAHSLLERLKIPHLFRDGPQRKHEWNSGWLPEAVELLLTAERDQR